MRLASTLLFLFPLALTPSFAQNAPAPAAPTLRVYSRETIVDVTVTDAKGNPVHGLTQSDFSIKEDNRPQPVRSFHEYDAQPVQPLPKLPSNVYTNLQPPAASAAVNILLLDFVNTAADVDHAILSQPQLRILSEAFEAQNHIKAAATKFLGGMPAGTRASVIGMAWPSSARILQGITSDPALLSAAVNTFPEGTQDGVTMYEQYCSQQETRNRMTLEVLNQLSVDLAPIKGRKNLIWFTVGSPSITDPSERLPCLPDYAVDLARTYARLTAAEVVLYPIDSRGNMTAPPGCFRDCLWIFANNTAAQKLSMESFAEATGGTAYYNSNDLATGIAKAVANGSDYYNLSYVPPGAKYDGRRHNIKVEVDRPDLHLVYRQGYAAEDPSIFKPTPGLSLALAADASNGPPDMRVQMTRAMPTSNGLVFDVRVQPAPASETAAAAPTVLGILNPKFKDKPLTRYTFDYSLPGEHIALPQGHGGLEFDLAAYDAGGNVVTSLRQAIKLNYTPDQAAQLVTDSFLYSQQLDLPPGALFLRIGLLDRTSNKLGTLEIPLTVAKK